MTSNVSRLNLEDQSLKGRVNQPGDACVFDSIDLAFSQKILRNAAQDALGSLFHDDLQIAFTNVFVVCVDHFPIRLEFARSWRVNRIEIEFALLARFDRAPALHRFGS